MIIVHEEKNHEHRLNEMFQADISSFADNLPFRVILQSPDHEPPHFHLYENQSEKEIARILMPKSKPRDIKDIVELTGKITDAEKSTLLLWLKCRNKAQAKLPLTKAFRRNWEVMRAVWGVFSR